jgi:hypothetical protein
MEDERINSKQNDETIDDTNVEQYDIDLLGNIFLIKTLSNNHLIDMKMMGFMLGAVAQIHQVDINKDMAKILNSESMTKYCSELELKHKMSDK